MKQDTPCDIPRRKRVCWGTITFTNSQRISTITKCRGRQSLRVFRLNSCHLKSKFLAWRASIGPDELCNWLISQTAFQCINCKVSMGRYLLDELRGLGLDRPRTKCLTPRFLPVFAMLYIQYVKLSVSLRAYMALQRTFVYKYLANSPASFRIKRPNPISSTDITYILNTSYILTASFCLWPGL